MPFRVCITATRLVESRRQVEGDVLAVQAEAGKQKAEQMKAGAPVCFLRWSRRLRPDCRMPRLSPFLELEGRQPPHYDMARRS